MRKSHIGCNPTIIIIILALFYTFLIPPIQIKWFGYLNMRDFDLGCSEMARSYVSHMGRSYTSIVYYFGRGEPKSVKRERITIRFFDKDGKAGSIDGYCIYTRSKKFIFSDALW